MRALAVRLCVSLLILVLFRSVSNTPRTDPHKDLVIHAGAEDISPVRVASGATSNTAAWYSILRLSILGCRLGAPTAFRLLAGEHELSDYQFGSKAGHHLFCRHCGVRSFARGYVEEIGGDYVAVQLGALDNADPTELIQAPVRFGDGRNNNWSVPPAETRHL